MVYNVNAFCQDRQRLKYRMCKGLIIRKEWLDKIFNSGKVWEMRSTVTNRRGLVKLIESKSGLIVGECHIIGCHKITEKEKVCSLEKHLVDDISLLDRWCFAWHIERVVKYDIPIPYKHPKGAVIWVNL